jgi:hypothetical protein
MANEPSQYPGAVPGGYPSGGMREGFGSELRSLGGYLPWNSPSVNQIRNNSMQGAVVGTPGTLPTDWISSNNTGLVPNVVGLGVDQGIDYIDIRLFGTSAGGTQTNIFFDGSTVITAAQGQVWTISAYFKIIAGNGVNGFSNINLPVAPVNNVGASVPGGTNGSALVAASGPNYWTRATTIGAAFTDPATAFVRPTFTFNLLTPPQTIDLTLRIGWPQLEQSGVATPPIRTAGAAASRLYRAVHQPDLGSPPNVVSVSGFGAGGLMGAFVANDAGQADQAQGMVRIWVGAAPAGSGTIVLRFPIAPTAGQYIALSDWATFTYGVAGNNLTINWTATRTLLPGEQLGVSYQWASST